MKFVLVRLIQPNETFLSNEDGTVYAILLAKIDD